MITVGPWRRAYSDFFRSPNKICSDGFCGQLGLGDKRPATVPKQIEEGGLEDECVMSISCGSRHTLAVTEEGEVWSWGLGHFGGLGRSFTPFEYDADQYDAVALGGDDAVIPVAAHEVNDNAEQQHREQDAGQTGQGLNDSQELRAYLDLINNLTLDDSSNQCYPMLVEPLKLTKAVGVSAGHRHR